MRFIKQENRDQLSLFPRSLSEEIGDDNEVRLIDAFIEQVDLVSHGFEFKTDKQGAIDFGGPSEYHPKELLKLYIYGYLNRIRSSRQLAKQCRINIEVRWLLSNLHPSHGTINSFRKNNAKAFKLLFRSFNVFWKSLGLFGEDTFGVDGSFFRAQNSKSNNYNEERINKHLEYLDKKTEEYLSLLEASDDLESKDKESLSTQAVQEKLLELGSRKEKYTALSNQLAESEDTQISTTDPDSRRLSKGKSSEIAYNVQVAAEESNKMIADFEVTNKGDSNAFHSIAKTTKDFLQDGDETKSINGLADKAYDTGEQIHRSAQDNIITYIAPKESINSKKDPRFRKNRFDYDKETDTYLCPENHFLTWNGKFYKKRDSKTKEYHLDFKVCDACPFKQACLGEYRLNKSKGKVIVRSEFEDAKEENKARVEANREVYQKRKEIVEHPFGTIKRQWGYSYTLLKGFEKVSAEFALIFSAYNLRRAISTLGVNAIIHVLNRVDKLVFASFFNYFNLRAIRVHYNRSKTNINTRLCELSQNNR